MRERKGIDQRREFCIAGTVWRSPTGHVGQAGTLRNADPQRVEAALRSRRFWQKMMLVIDLPLAGTMEPGLVPVSALEESAAALISL